MSFLPGDDSGRLNGVSFVRLVIPGKEVVTASGAGLNTSAERRPATLGIHDLPPPWAVDQGPEVLYGESTKLLLGAP